MFSVSSEFGLSVEISDCESTGEISVSTVDWTWVGGIGGYLQVVPDGVNVTTEVNFKIDNCNFDGNVTVGEITDSFCLGGITGSAHSLTISNCSSKGVFNIYSKNAAKFGSLVGDASSSLFIENEVVLTKIIDCLTGTVVNTKERLSTYYNLFYQSNFTYIENSSLKQIFENKYYYQTLTDEAKGFYEEIYNWAIELKKYPLTEFEYPQITIGHVS